jgi:hypothetical protein
MSRRFAQTASIYERRKRMCYKVPASGRSRPRGRTFMRKYSLRHLSNAALTCALLAVARNENAATALVLAHIAEFDRRRLCREAGYSSMYRYCLGVLHLSEQAAYKRIRAARTARQFPWIFEEIASGQLHLSAVVLLASHLTRENARELLTAAVHKTKAEVERLLAERFPRPDVPTTVLALAVPRELSPGTVDGPNVLQLNAHEIGATSLCPAPAAQAPQPEPPVPSARLAPLSPSRFHWNLTVDQETQDLAVEAQELLSHQQHELPQILCDALRVYVAKLRKQKYAATANPRPQGTRAGNDPRYIPNAVKQAVWQRDNGQCTFVSESGHRCEARTLIEYDHIDPVARGGYATVEKIRLRCRAHNQLEAERVFGAAFMEAKRGASSSA